MIEKFEAEDVTALVVEDEETTRDLVVRLLTAMGAAEIFTAADGGEGLRLACEKLPGLVVCDLEMAPVDGLAFLGGLRASANPAVAKIPVVMFTSNTDGTSVGKAKALGVSDYLVKPFNPKGFATHVRKALEG